jgi:excisionase family DNA binding protein
MSLHPTNMADSPSEEDRNLAIQSRRQLATLLPQNGSSISINLAQDESRQPIVLPAIAVSLLVDMLAQIALGNTVTLLPLHTELTTQEAADHLNVSRPFLVKLLESGELPFRKVGKHRRVYLRDLLAYKDRIDRDRNEALNELVAQAQELNMGYE